MFLLIICSALHTVICSNVFLFACLSWSSVKFFTLSSVHMFSYLSVELVICSYVFLFVCWAGQLFSFSPCHLFICFPICLLSRSSDQLFTLSSVLMFPIFCWADNLFSVLHTVICSSVFLFVCWAGHLISSSLFHLYLCFLFSVELIICSQFFTLSSVHLFSYLSVELVICS